MCCCLPPLPTVRDASVHLDEFPTLSALPLSSFLHVFSDKSAQLLPRDTPRAAYAAAGQPFLRKKLIQQTPANPQKTTRFVDGRQTTFGCFDGVYCSVHVQPFPKKHARALPSLSVSIPMLQWFS
jgi:hypothetical protein